MAVRHEGPGHLHTAGASRVDSGLNPGHDIFQQFMATEAAADAMKADGVRPETLLILNEE
jgi:hypothetical protein